MKLTRPPVSAVTSGLTTTADKIRALARAGYRRTEISKTLEIRYQHVRKVLVDAGIMGGLSSDLEFGRPALTVPAAEQQEPVADLVLLQSGFRFLGQWQETGEGEFELSAKAPVDSGVYAFVVDGFVRYVGLTQRGIRTRMGHYRRGHVRQKTSARVKALIALALAEGKKVDVLIATPEPLDWNGLPVNTAAGLEAGLIRMIRPDWNMLGVGVPAESVSPRNGSE